MRKRNWRKMISAMITGALLLGALSTSAFAAGANVLDSTTADVDPAGPGYSLMVTGLEEDDTVKYYQIIEQDVDTVNGEGVVTRVGSQQWKLSASVDANGDGIVDGTEDTDFGHKAVGKDRKLGTADDVSVNGLFVDELVIGDFTEEGDVVTSDTRQLTPRMVNALVTAATNNKADAEGELTAADIGDGIMGVFVNYAAAGMYMFIAVPGSGDTDYIYKPVFVSADYYNAISTPEDNTHSIELVDNVTDYPETSGQAADAGVFKRSPLSIDKQSGPLDEDGNPLDQQTDVAVGDDVEFRIIVPIPTYTENYVAPMFYITDVLTEGLVLDPGSIEVVVKNGEEEVTTALDKDYKIYVKGDANDPDATDYFDFKNTEPEDSTFDGFVVQFLNDDPDKDGQHDGFLYTVLGAPTATITYKAKVTETAKQKFAQQVNQMDNTAKLNYSQDPNYIPDGYFSATPVEKEVPVIDPETGEPKVKTDPETGEPIVKIDPETGDPVQKTDPETGEPVVERVPVIDPETGEPQIDPETGEPVYEEVPVYEYEIETTIIEVNEPDPDFDTNDPDTKDEDGNEEDTGVLEDKTRHYTFDIDADVLGRDQSKDTQSGPGGEPGEEPLEEEDHDRTSEIRKIWIGSNGQIIQKKDSKDVVLGGAEEDGVSGEATGNYGWLEGAEFTLTKIADHTVVEPGTGEFTELAEADRVQMKFDPTTHILTAEGGENPKSDGKGYIAMKGLDAGVYILKEIKAPLGYSFNPNIQYEITIEPTYVLEPPTPEEGTTPEDGKGGADDLILESYTVTIVTQELDDKMNIISGSEVTTISTYNLKKDENDSPISLLKEDGTSNTDPDAPATETVVNPETGDEEEVELPVGGLEVTVQTNADNETATVVNKRLGLLPATGGSGLPYYILIGAAIAVFFLAMIRKLRKAGMAS